NGYGFAQKTNYKNLSMHLLGKLDSSCRNSPPPDINNGKFVRFKKTRIEAGKPKSKRYMVAEFKCNEGYKFRNSHPKKMFCSKKKWVGKKPVCDKIKNDFDTLQGDDPSAASPQYFLNSGECSPEDQAKCTHMCRMRDGQPLCDCLPGFEKDGSDCR
ncbi:uncharacterized protein LOC111692632, partial [Anoplophora glabripennis]|uniref:uncharacterized protein LOC111692632 n=1 Tax=Anoplophora glabripennis TaxID=217634 RepID=UPI000C788CF9